MVNFKAILFIYSIVKDRSNGITFQSYIKVQESKELK